MALPYPVIARLVADGCTLEQVFGAIEAEYLHRQELRAAREARRQARLEAAPAVEPASRAGNVTSARPVLSRAVTLSPLRAVTSDTSVKGDSPPGPHPDSRRLMAMARKALNIDGSLPARARRACGVLLDCYNHETGRCDPGIVFIARGLGVAGRTVKRALRELEARGLVHIWRHQGRYHCNAYGFDWDALAALGAAPAEDVTFAQGDSSGPPQVTLSVTQTQSLNPDRTPATGEGVSRARPVRSRPIRPPDRRQREMLLVMDGGSGGEKATAAAERRLMRDLHERHGGDAALFQAVFAGDGTVYELAVAAERRQPRSGLAALHRALLASAATGPPAARAS